MTEKEQIEEIAKYCCNACDFSDVIDLENNIYPCAIDNEYKTCPLALETAEKIYNAGYRKQSEWISIDERLPEKSCECLVATNIGGIYQVNYSHRYKAFNALDTDEAKYAMHSVTHWMPLPEAPKMKGGAE